MENFITVKREDGAEITNPAERNIILLRYAAFLNENENNGINIVQTNHHQPAQTFQIVENPNHLRPPPPRKSTKANVQNAQVNIQQKVGG
jgi:hypothetical protein